MEEEEERKREEVDDEGELWKEKRTYFR